MKFRFGHNESCSCLLGLRHCCNTLYEETIFLDKKKIGVEFYDHQLFRLKYVDTVEEGFAVIENVLL